MAATIPQHVQVSLPSSTVAATYLQRVLRAALAFGARKPVLLERLGIPERELAHPLARVSSLLLARLLDAGAEEAGVASFALDLGKLVRPRSFSDVGYGTRFCPTVGEAVTRAIERQAHTQTVSRLEMDVEGRELRLTIRFLGDCPNVMRRLTELQTTSNLHGLWTLAGGELGIRQIGFAHERPPWAAHYGLFYGTSPEFGADQSVVVMSSAILSRRIPTACPRIAARLDDRRIGLTPAGDGTMTVAQLCAAFATSELDKAPVTLERAAEAFGTTSRSLRRHLHEQGTSFRAIVEQVRRELAELYRMEGIRSVGDIALALGYSDISAYSRAHAGWHGTAPSRFRPALRELETA